MEDIERTEAMEQSLAEDALREFEIDLGLVTPETAGVEQSVKQLGLERDRRVEGSTLFVLTVTAAFRRRNCTSIGGSPKSKPCTRDPAVHSARHCPLTSPYFVRGGTVSSETPPASFDSTKLPGTAGAEVPSWYPDWGQELGGPVFFGQRLPVRSARQCPRPGCHLRQRPARIYCNLTEFLAQQLFGVWDIVFSYDLGRGLRLSAGPDAKRNQQMVEYATRYLGGHGRRGPEIRIRSWLPSRTLFSAILLEQNPQQQKRIAFLFEHAQYLLPAGGLSMLARGQASRLVRMISWAQNPYIKRVNMAFCLVADKTVGVERTADSKSARGDHRDPAARRTGSSGVCRTLA